MSGRSTLLRILVCCALGLGLAALLFLPGGRRGVHEHPERVVSESAESAAAAAPERGQALRTALLDGPNASFLIVDAGGTPIAGAVAHVPCPSRRHGLVERPLGTSDASGHLTIDAARVASGDDVVAQSPGYLPSRFAVRHETGGERRIVLQRGAYHHVECKDAAGKPIAGVRVLISRAQLDDRDLDRVPGPGVLPGADPASAIHIAHTDARGIATFSGLAPGQYMVRSVKEGLTWVDGDRHLPHVPGRPTRVVLGPLYATVVKVTGDEVLSWRFRTRTYSARGDLMRVRYGAALDAVRRLERKLRARFPDAIVTACALKKVPGSFGVPPTECFLRLRRHCDVRVPVDTRPPDRWSEPQVIDVTTVAEVADETSLCTFELVDKTGKPVDTDFCLVDPKLGIRGDVFYVRREARRARIPKGRYRVDAGSVLFGKGPIVEITGEKAESHRVVLPFELQRCELVVKDPWGRRCQTGNIAFRAADGRRRSFHTEHLHELVMWMPVGEIEIAATTWGSRETKRKLRVAPAQSVQTIELALEAN